MTFTVTYREKNGAKVQEPGSRPAPRRLPESRRVKRPVIGAGVEAKILDADSLKSACKFHRCRFYRKTLVVQDKPKNVEPRCRGWFAKDSRFVHEQTQCSALSHRLINKSDGNCFTSLKAEDFPRITTTPALRPTSACILPNRRAVGKCKSLEITFLDMEEKAA